MPGFVDRIRKLHGTSPMSVLNQNQTAESMVFESTHIVLMVATDPHALRLRKIVRYQTITAKGKSCFTI